MKKNVTAFIISLVFTSFSHAQITVSGQIKTEEGEPIEGVIIYAVGNNNQSVVTTQGGLYTFTLDEGEDYTITPHKNDDVLNGVSTFDRVLISKHIDGTQLLDSPYKIIAADVNNDQSITTSDLVDLYDLIIWSITQFPNNTSWRFIEEDFVFADPQDPFATALPEVVTINNLTNDILDLDFIAVKVGDVNGSAANGSTGSGPAGIITGQVYFDMNSNCTVDPGETPLSEWKTYAKNANGDIFYGFTNDSGTYGIIVPPDTYDVYVVEENALWEACIDSVANVEVSTQSLSHADFGIHATDYCANMEVNLSTSFLRRCFDNFYQVRYCNQGTEDATGVYIEVTLDTFFSNISSSIPWTSVNENTYTFDIGDVGIGECNNFIIEFLLDCDAELGQTHCSSAHIYPEPTCIPVSPNYGGAEMEITGECLGSEVKFTITNHGEDMQEPVDYIVIEDIMIQKTGEFQLNNGESEMITKPANGSTWRIQSNEVDFHPFETIAAAAVEGCGVNGTGSFSMGIVNQFPLSDEEPFEDEDCQENLGSFDPNDKIGFPIGYDVERIIEKGQDISYRIRFQNTGTDTAFYVRILDLLPPELDPATLRIENSSHPMEYDLSGEGLLRFTFDNIMLPDSNTNEPLSHGFVKFSISQKPGLELGTMIENEARIYFDFNDPVVTNLSLHTIGERLLEVNATEVFIPNLKMKVYPNPSDAFTTFELNGINVKNGELHLLNLNGSVVSSQNFRGDKFQFDGSILTAGIYFFQIKDEGMPIAIGKIIVQ